MKYKRLNQEELKALEAEFIQFLASAQITAHDWEKMKREQPEQAEELIDVFSDVVYDKVLRKIEYLEFRDSGSLNVFFCAPERAYLLGLLVQEQSGLDLSSDQVLEQWLKSGSAGISLVQSSKDYKTDREQEIFDLLQSGCWITDGKLYSILNQLKSPNHG